jgi:uncharacterized protein (DUF2235 family)
VGWIENPVRLPYTSNNPDIRIGRHAIAIDERRAFFRSNLWHPTASGGPKDIKQVWFPGVHCDVGGGYPEAESALAKIPLGWMLEEARNAGLPGRAAASSNIRPAGGQGCQRLASLLRRTPMSLPLAGARRRFNDGKSWGPR